MLALKKRVRRKKTILTDTEVWAAATCNFDTIQARPPFFPLGVGKEEDKGRLCSQGGHLKASVSVSVEIG